MSLRTNLSNSTAWYTVGNLFIRSVSFILLPLYSNLINTSDFGNYSVLISVYAIVAVLYQFGMQSALSKFYIEEENEARRKSIFSTILNFVIILGLIITTLAFLFSKTISLLILNSPKFYQLVEIIFVALLFETIGYFFLHLLKTKQNSKRVVFASSMAAIFNFILNIVFVYWLRFSVEGIFLAQVFSALFLITVLLPDIKNDYINIIDKIFLKKLIKFSYPFVIGGILTAAVDFSDRFILNHFLGISEVGIYGFSYRIAMIMNLFVISFRTAWIPYGLNLFYKNEDFNTASGKTVSKLLAISFLIFLAVSLFANDLFKIKISDINLFNSAYQSGVVIVPFVLLGYLFNGLVSFYSIYPYTSNKTFHFLISDALAFVVNIFLNLILIPIWGISGAAVATTFAFMIAAVYLFLISRNKIKIVYPIRQLSIILVSASAIFIIAIIFNFLILNFILLAIYAAIIYRYCNIDVTRILRFSNGTD